MRADLDLDLDGMGWAGDDRLRRSRLVPLFASHRDDDDDDGDEFVFHDAREVEGDDDDWTIGARWECLGGRSSTRESSLCGSSGGPTRCEERWKG